MASILHVVSISCQYNNIVWIQFHLVHDCHSFYSLTFYRQVLPGKYYECGQQLCEFVAWRYMSKSMITVQAFNHSIPPLVCWATCGQLREYLSFYLMWTNFHAPYLTTCAAKYCTVWRRKLWWPKLTNSKTLLQNQRLWETKLGNSFFSLADIDSKSGNWQRWR